MSCRIYIGVASVLLGLCAPAQQDVASVIARAELIASRKTVFQSEPFDLEWVIRVTEAGKGVASTLLWQRFDDAEEEWIESKGGEEEDLVDLQSEAGSFAWRMAAGVGLLGQITPGRWRAKGSVSWNSESGTAMRETNWCEVVVLAHAGNEQVMKGQGTHSYASAWMAAVSGATVGGELPIPPEIGDNTQQVARIAAWREDLLTIRAAGVSPVLAMRAEMCVFRGNLRRLVAGVADSEQQDMESGMRGMLAQWEHDVAGDQTPLGGDKSIVCELRWTFLRRIGAKVEARAVETQLRDSWPLLRVVPK
jgi:hypothetical protein